MESDSAQPSLCRPLQSSTILSTERREKRTPHILHKRRHGDGHQPYERETMELPDRLKTPGGDGKVEEDVMPQAGGTYGMTMNQSIFGLIAAAGTSINFNDRFEGHSSDGDDDADGSSHMVQTELRPSRVDSQKTRSPDSLAQTRKGAGLPEMSHRRHRRKISGSRLLKSVPVLSKLSSKSKSKSSRKLLESHFKEEEEDESDHAQEALPESPSPESPPFNGRSAPVMSRILESQAQMAARPSFDLDEIPRVQDYKDDDTGLSELAKKLKEIFEFEKSEEVIAEYPCWLLQHVLVRGYMYITSNHVTFYAYMPKRANETSKSGFLSKSGKRNPKFHRYWFRLKGDVLSYYRDSNNPYFPSGQIDLRYSISADITDREREGLHFSLVTDQRTYHFKADSAPSAKEWVKSLQRVIFRSHNEGDSVKISLPTENVIDIEEVTMLDITNTLKIRVFDNDETYAIDEYYFSFFKKLGPEVLRVLRLLTEGASSANSGDEKQAVTLQSDKNESSSPRASIMDDSLDSQNQPKLRTAKMREKVRATSPAMSPKDPQSPNARGRLEKSCYGLDALRLDRHSMEESQMAARQKSPLRSLSDSRRSMSPNRSDEGHLRPHKQTSTDSFGRSIEDPSQSSQASLSALVVSGSDEATYASQNLGGSDVFHSPTVQRSATESARAAQVIAAEPPRVHPRHAVKTGHVLNPGAGEKVSDGPLTPTLQSFGRMAGYPFQKAGALAGFSKRMSTMLATESMGYVEKVSGMWKGGKKHYEEPPELKTDEEENEVDAEDREASNQRFRAHFILPDAETLQATYFGYMSRTLPLYGKMYISHRHFCFRSLLPGTRTKVILPHRDIETVNKTKGYRFGYSGLVVVVRGHEELFFEFGKADVRDDCAITLLQGLEATRHVPESACDESKEMEKELAAVAERDALQEARAEGYPEHAFSMPRQPSGVDNMPTIPFDDPKASFLNFKPKKPLRITCLTIGSRGDVQPYIALCKGLQREGHEVRIATHLEFKDWIEGHGIEFGLVEGDPSELMRICIKNGTFTWQFLKEANAKFRGWLDELLVSAWMACQHSDLLIESPSAMAGIHIAERLGIPYFRAFGMPWTRTRAYPHAFIVPGQKMGGSFNYMTYVMFDNVFWKATAHQVNRWRNKMLGLPNTSLEKMQVNKVPFLYNFSPVVVPPPLDFSDWIRVTGYWFLDEGNGQYEPANELIAFIRKAREDRKKIVYVGFGSIIVPEPAKMTLEVIEAVQKADVRCILSRGWNDRLDATSRPSSDKPLEQKATETHTQSTLPPDICEVESVPHDWLFTQIDAAAHHGGSGTTGASLRAGIPTIVRPFFGDQYFFGNRVEDLGVGICLKKWGALSFGRALWEATHSERMITKAKIIGEQIRKENGVDMAIQFLYRDLEYATSLIRSKAGKNAVRSPRAVDAGDEPVEESWTFVDDGNDADINPEDLLLPPPELLVAEDGAEASLYAKTPEFEVRVAGSSVMGKRSDR